MHPLTALLQDNPRVLAHLPRRVEVSRAEWKAWKVEIQGYLAAWKGRARGIEVGASRGFHVVRVGD
jgi:hypothetical protein